MVDATLKNQNIENKVIQVVNITLKKKTGNIGLDDPLLSSDGHFDSFSLMELVLHLEETFNIEIPDDHLDPDNFYSIKSITSYIKNRSYA